MDHFINTTMFKVGDQLSSVEELEEKIQLLRDEYSVDLWKQDCSKKSYTTKRTNINPKLKYYEVSYWRFFIIYLTTLNMAHTYNCDE